MTSSLVSVSYNMSQVNLSVNLHSNSVRMSTNTQRTVKHRWRTDEAQITGSSEQDMHQVGTEAGSSQVCWAEEECFGS